MKKTEYKMIAQILRDAPVSAGVDSLYTWGSICEHTAEELAKTFTGFDTVEFLDACGFDLAFGYEWRESHDN